MKFDILLMMNDLQFENHENTFLEFGNILFIYTFFYIGSIVLVLISEYISIFVSHILSASINSVYIAINSVILFLLFYKAQKIKKVFSPNGSLKIFSIGLLIWFILYISMNVISIIHPFIPTYRRLYSNITLTISVLTTLISIIQLIIWNSLSSFFKNSDKNLAPAIKNNGHTASKILVVAAGIGIFGGIIDTSIKSLANSINSINSINFGVLTIMMLTFFISLAVSFILFVIGYFLLSTNLKKRIINWNSEGLPNRNVPAPEQRFCQFCGYHVEPFMQFCPDCGKSLKR